MEMSPVPYFINPKSLGKLVAGKLGCHKFDMDLEGILSMAVFYLNTLFSYLAYV